MFDATPNYKGVSSLDSGSRQRCQGLVARTRIHSITTLSCKNGEESAEDVLFLDMVTMNGVLTDLGASRLVKLIYDSDWLVKQGPVPRLVLRLSNAVRAFSLLLSGRNHFASVRQVL
jgi:hypothetical protein